MLFGGFCCCCFVTKIHFRNYIWLLSLNIYAYIFVSLPSLTCPSKSWNVPTVSHLASKKRRELFLQKFWTLEKIPPTYNSRRKICGTEADRYRTKQREFWQPQVDKKIVDKKIKEHKNIEQSKETEECRELTGGWAEWAEWKMMEGNN